MGKSKDSKKRKIAVAPGHRKANPVPRATLKELNYVGTFDWTKGVTEEQEINDLHNDQWYPATDDFKSVIGKRPLKVISRFDNLLYQISLQKNGSIKQLNVFTHANPAMVSFGGEITRNDLEGATVMMDINNDEKDYLVAMDPFSMDNLNEPGRFFTTIKERKKITVDEIRKKFAPDAVFVLYACHSGQKKKFLDQIAQFFQVKVIGFGDSIIYHVPYQSGNKFHRAGIKISLGKEGRIVDDFHDLMKDPQIITGSPE